MTDEATGHYPLSMEMLTNLHEENKRLSTENARLRVALEKIRDGLGCVTLEGGEKLLEFKWASDALKASDR